MKILKFKADWCSPCRTLSGMLDGFKECPIEDVNIGLEPNRATEYGVRALPTLILLDDENQEIWRNTGLIDKMKLEQIVIKANKQKSK